MFYQLRAVMQKEFAGYFRTPTAYIIIAVCNLLFRLFFRLRQQRTDIFLYLSAGNLCRADAGGDHASVG